ncbi:unnamed protein product [Brachionus calyciflorus]|uniref:Uncharacterized protein n=1 Tax=Brachionus calyciflorus TaxID=104777 RepID=A0A813ZHS4_9BILA|nr:unnamed protein product [Brachionus calyciflorus]
MFHIKSNKPKTGVNQTNLKKNLNSVENSKTNEFYKHSVSEVGKIKNEEFISPITEQNRNFELEIDSKQLKPRNFKQSHKSRHNIYYYSKFKSNSDAEENFKQSDVESNDLYYSRYQKNSNQKIKQIKSPLREGGVGYPSKRFNKHI